MSARAETPRSRTLGPARAKPAAAFATTPLDAVRDDVATRLFEAALAGAKALMGFWKCAQQVSAKADGSLVSAADHAADAAVRSALAELGVRAPMVSEESKGHVEVGDDLFLLLDPLDGTNEFLDHGDEFCVCLAAIYRGRPVAGAIVAPALRRAWQGGASAHAVLLDPALAPTARERLHAGLRRPGGEVVGLVSRRHGDPRSIDAVRDSGASRTITASSAVKFGMLAEGRADLHVRHGRTMAWDIAAGDAILAAAGGKVMALTGRDLVYHDRSAEFANPPFVAASRPELAIRLVDQLQRAS